MVTLYNAVISMSYKDDEWSPQTETEVDFGGEINLADDADDDMDEGDFVPGVADDGDDDDMMSDQEY